MLLLLAGDDDGDGDDGKPPLLVVLRGVKVCVVKGCRSRMWTSK